MEPVAQPPRLCYLKADQLRGPVKTFDHLDVMDRNDENIGRLDGVLIDAAARRMQYFVIEQGFLHRRRYLLPMSLTSIDTNVNVLRMLDVAKGDLTVCERFNPDTYRSYSDEDLLAGLFHGYHDEGDAITEVN